MAVKMGSRIGPEHRILTPTEMAQRTREHKTPITAVAHPTIALTPIAMGPNIIRAHDRDVRILSYMHQTPYVTVLQGLLSDDECDEMVRKARPKLIRSKTVKKEEPGEEEHPHRTSSGTYFLNDEFPLIETINKRIEALTNWPLADSEQLQILNYTPGAEYLPHYDYFPPEDPGSGIHLVAGQRVGTLICFLADTDVGGATIFPDFNFQVAPIKGNAVFFTYDRPHPDTKSLHGGSQVVVGEKWIFTRWFREKKT